MFIFFFQAEDGIRDTSVTGVQTCALPISLKVSAVRERYGVLEYRSMGVLGFRSVTPLLHHSVLQTRLRFNGQPSAAKIRVSFSSSLPSIRNGESDHG